MKPPVEPRVKIWVVFDDRTKFGDGRAALLESIDELGSINKAVARFGMSYRAAWGYIRELEAAAGFQLVRRTPGRGAQSGTRLTARGRRFLERYRTFEHGVEESMERQFARVFKGHSP